MAEGYQAVAFEQEAPLRSGEAVRLTRAEVKPSAVADVVDVYGDTAVPRLADTPGFCSALLFADPTGGQLLSRIMRRDPHARTASPSIAEMIRAEVLGEDDCQIRAVENCRLVFNSTRKPDPAWW